MPQKFPKVTQKINQQIQTNQQQMVQPNIGVIIGYDPVQNTAQVMLTQRGGEGYGEIYNNVSCPHPMGVQSTAPSQGTQCQIVFKDGNRGRPIITHFLNTTNYAAGDYARNNYAINNTPNFTHAL